MSKLDNFFTAPISSRTIAFACADPKRTKCFSCMTPFQGIVRVGGGQTRAFGVFHAYTMSLFILGMWCPRSPAAVVLDKPRHRVAPPWRTRADQHPSHRSRPVLPRQSRSPRDSRSPARPERCPMSRRRSLAAHDEVDGPDDGCPARDDRLAIGAEEVAPTVLRPPSADEELRIEAREHE